jgi:CRISPR-associated protein Cmr6
MKMSNEDANNVPLMFQAQIPDRGKIQYAGNVEPATKWINQWLNGCPPAPETVDKNIPIWKRPQVQPAVKLPEFGADVHTQKYQIRWRLITNSGQDEDVIRPVIGAKGLPFFPGSSMKGAFRRACLTDAERDRYCGGTEKTDRGEKRTVPGLLRFHGGYPDMASWKKRDRLVDVVHGQQPYQVMQSSASHTANVQISLYQPRFKFGISCTKPLSKTEWDKIWEIWERALGSGIGSRVSAGYGYVDKVNKDESITPIENCKRVIFSAILSGQGITSQLLNRTAEFRPNMFKAVLRGHTLRILAGITNEAVAKALTQKIWGGIDGGATVGNVGILFAVDDKDIQLGEHIYRPNGKGVSMPIYKLKIGRFDLLQVSEISTELRQFLRQLIRFSMLLGGFGKSWRRIHHKLFDRSFDVSYFKNDDKPMIGCHWEFLQESEKLWVLNNASGLSSVTQFLQETQASAIAWLQSEGYQPNGYVKNWRETWHPTNVQVWGRIAQDNGDSQAIQWFHGNYFDRQSIKNSELTGWAARRGFDSQVGRIWHRMYPRYVKDKAGNLIRLKNQYIELLTIFPDRSVETKQFLDFLNSQSNFNQLWGNK